MNSFKPLGLNKLMDKYAINFIDKHLVAVRIHIEAILMITTEHNDNEREMFDNKRCALSGLKLDNANRHQHRLYRRCKKNHPFAEVRDNSRRPCRVTSPYLDLGGRRPPPRRRRSRRRRTMPDVFLPLPPLLSSLGRTKD
ncbi:uncharacterized protein LOC113003233 [Solenopsis invicta]|uniref:uncharacterized protein LOC113003233 n=1 Tax=Solenopsis invicta TaxID=13686 RepID=UPI00193DF411|nr:uncharacterized protein LOC113003233 [Solenopsis invicta]